MRFKRLLLIGASLLAIPLTGSARAQEAPARYMQIAEIEVDPAQLEAYNAAVTEHIQAAIQTEPGVLVLYAVAHKDDPARITVFEVYRDVASYSAHLETPHFKRYKTTVEKMVKSLKLVQVTPVMLGSK